MFNFWEMFVLNAVMGILAGLRKEPSKVPAFKNVLVHILDDVCILLGVTAPTVP